jgi:hypothetical protein
LDQRFFTSEFLSWDLLTSQSTGTAFATVALLAFLSYEEVERHQRYTGPHGIRNLIFPNKSKSFRASAIDMSKVFKKTRSALSRRRSGSSVGSAASQESNDSTHTPRGTAKGGELPPAVLVYHESARSIVFRDHLRRAADHQQSSAAPKEESGDADANNAAGDLHVDQELSTSGDLPEELTEMATLFGGGDQFRNEKVEIQGFQPNVVPLPHLELGPNDEFLPLLASDHSTQDSWTRAEVEAVQMLDSQHAVVKTIKNSDWTSFLRRFKTAEPPKGRYPDDHNDIAAHETFPFNSYVTSTTLLPAGARKMRCYGAPTVYTTGVVFGLPEFSDKKKEDAMVEQTRTWSWPSGYSAKTEFNIDSCGNLINGRQEALVPLSKLREYNEDYLTKQDYVIAGRVLKGGLKTVPYNEVFVRVGGRGGIVNGKDCATGEDRVDAQGTGRSLDQGVGLPIALFVRTSTFGHLISLLRTRARLLHVLGERHIQGIPLLLISPEFGIRVLTDKLQCDLLQIAARNLNPFQNPLLAHKTTINDTDERHLEAKLEELIELDESIRQTLTPEECVRLAGGFGATDESVAQILNDAMIQDKESLKNGANGSESHKLQDIINEGLASAVRSGDYYTSRQLLILYSIVSSEEHQMETEEVLDKITDQDGNSDKLLIRKKSLDSEATLLKRQAGEQSMTINDQNSRLPPRPPPPPLDTDRLRSATNSDGLLAVLGAAQVLKAMQDGSAKKRTEESFLAVEEWCENGEQSMAFRLASWRDQRAAQDDLQIAFDKDSSFMAFVSNKAITNRKNFAKQLREATQQTNFTDVRFFTTIYEMVCRMHSPCLRLELLQYVLGLDNRYSIAHVKRSIELAATCLSISTTH